MATRSEMDNEIAERKNEIFKAMTSVEYYPAFAEEQVDIASARSFPFDL